MLHLCYSNRLEVLLEALAIDLDLRREAAGPFEPVRLVVPSRAMGEWLKHALASRDGIAANLEVHFLRRFVAGLLESAAGTRAVTAELVQDLLLARLLDDAGLERPGLEPVRGWLHAAGDAETAVDLRRVQLATELANLFEEYGFSRPEMLTAWPDGGTLPAGPFGATEAWQRRLWLELFGASGALARRSGACNARILQITDALGPAIDFAALDLERPIHVFGVSYVAVTFQRILARLAEHADLRIYTLNPCMEFWEDLKAGFELRRPLPRRAERLGAAAFDHADPFGLSQPEGPPALSLWGRPGRENIRMLNELSACDYHTLFVDPCAKQRSVLRQLQRDVLLREPERTEPHPDFDFGGDRSVQVLQCAGVRREAEEIAGEIWSLLREDHGPEPLRFGDIAVLVAARDPAPYLTHLTSVFHDTWELPYSLSESSLAQESSVAEALTLLLALPLGGISRGEVLRAVTHPAVAARYPDADPEEWIRCCDALGIVHGLDHRDHAQTYIERDILNWDQGLRRLALGAVMTGARSGDGRLFALGEERYLPEERSGDAAAELGLLVRSLLADARFAREAKLRTADWAEFFATMAAAYLVPRTAADEADLDRCLRVLRGLADFELDGREVSYSIAQGLVAAGIAGLGRSRGGPVGAGIAIGTLQGLRALPFRVVFVAGLNEGSFPASDRRNALDLRLAAPRAGDVSPRERDQYLFLETLLSARDRLYLSYVARDELTGDAREPSSVLAELQRMIRRGYKPDDAPGAPLLRSQPLRRYDPRYFPSLFERDGEDFPAGRNARREAQTLALREQLDVARGVDLDALRAQLAPELRARLDAHLGIAAAPRAEHAAEPETRRISLTALRWFLECPLQGSVRVLLGLVAEDDADLLSLEDEPFATPFPANLSVLRQSLLETLVGEHRGASPLEVYEALADRELLAGHMPSGPFAAVERTAHRAQLDSWSKLIPEVVGAAPAIGERLRFGGAREESSAETAMDPIVFELDGGRAGGAAGTKIRVEITGRTEPLLLDRGASLVLELRDPARDLWEPVRRLRKSLRGFLDRVVLSAAGLAPDLGHETAVCMQSALDRLHLAPISQEEAMGWLESLVADLLSGIHGYFLPCEAVFLHRAGGGTGSVADCVRAVVAGRNRFQSQYGPVRHPERYPVPDEAAAAAMIERRFGLFFAKSLDGPAAPTKDSGEGGEAPKSSTRGRGGRKEARR